MAVISSGVFMVPVACKLNDCSRSSFCVIEKRETPI